MTVEPVVGPPGDLDSLIELLYGITPEGYKSEVVGGAVHMWPQTNTSWDITADVLFQLTHRFGEVSDLWHDVRLDLPGHHNAFAPDLFKLSGTAGRDTQGRHRYQDVEFVLEVISRETAGSDYGAKKAAYAAGAVPVYLIADPCTARWHLFTLPRNGEYRSRLSLDFGEPVDLTDTVLGMTLATDRFPRD
ncbi:Uma2 family endonuclease [Streptomyces niger]|uniref:Uma2 family endonuclease n=1 Tax=Streptomyces niger TaxID=66373 RepID=UPI00069B6901|nr:Uma2 family endonuclease [Streptomyces niger]